MIIFEARIKGQIFHIFSDWKLKILFTGTEIFKQKYIFY